jgi:beta-lactamase class A
MTLTLTRRSIAATAFGAALCGALPARAQNAAADPRSEAHLAQAQAAIRSLEARNGGRLGVVAVHTGSGGRISYRGDERFAMCSTHKFLTAAAVLAMVDRGEITLTQHVSYGHADLLDYAPVTRKNVDTGFMTVDGLCAAAIEWSDNTAENLLLKLIGGPPGWTRYARSIGDTVSRLDRFEPEPRSSRRAAWHDSGRRHPRKAAKLDARQQDHPNAAAGRPASGLARCRQVRVRRHRHPERYRPHPAAERGPDPCRRLLYAIHGAPGRARDARRGDRSLPRPSPSSG